MSMTRHVATVRDCIIWAKDRLVDDLTALVGGEYFDVNYAAMTAKQRREFRQRVDRLNTLLSADENDPSVLPLFVEAGYWNGAADTFWETSDPPQRVDASIKHLFPDTWAIR